MSDWKRFQVAFDTHGDLLDATAASAFFKFKEIWKPEIRIGGGDHFDNRPIRRAANEDEKRESLEVDFRAGMSFLREFQPTHVTWGNHDKRFWDIAEANRGPLSDYAKDKIREVENLCKEMRTKTYPYDKRYGILEIGELRIAHGYAHGINAARRMAQAYGSVLFGHIHAIHSASVEGLSNRIGRACGCLCKLDPQYAATSLGSLVWRHGFPYGVINVKTGIYHFFQAECISGTWVMPSDIITIESPLKSNRKSNKVIL